jgi:hypothetical protein
LPSLPQACDALITRGAKCSRHAIQLAGQLSEEREDALLVLQAMTRLVMLPGFWGGEPEKKPAATTHSLPPILYSANGWLTSSSLLKNPLATEGA